MTLLPRVRHTIDRDELAPAGSRVLAAISGGSDSALFHVLRQLAGECGFVIAGVVHLNHGLRGEESDADEAFCRALAAEYGQPIEVGRRDVAQLARDERVSIEVAARRARYDFFADAVGRLNADRIATGHTRDDQAETFLLRVLRGAGATGLAGIRPRRGPVVRPLLDVRRDELLAWLASLGQPFRTDASNRDLRIPRNCPASAAEVVHRIAVHGAQLDFLAVLEDRRGHHRAGRHDVTVREDQAALGVDDGAGRLARLVPLGIERPRLVDLDRDDRWGDALEGLVPRCGVSAPPCLGSSAATPASRPRMRAARRAITAPGRKRRGSLPRTRRG